MADKVLVVDDDKTILTMLHKALKSSGITADLAISGEAAITLLAENEYDLILLDINMRGMDGFEVIQKIRGDGLSTPVMVVSGRKEDKDALYGLEIGADDYIGKPFYFPFLLSKVKATLRRNYPDASEDKILKYKDLYVDLNTMAVHKGDKTLQIGGKELEILIYFLKHPDKVIAKETLFDAVWGSECDSDISTLAVYIRWLREKIEDDPKDPKYIHTIWRVGYRFGGDRS